MSFQEWIKAMPFDFWLLFVLALMPFFAVIYQLHRDEARKAARFFFLGTVCVIGVLVWAFFGKPRREGQTPDARVPITRTWAIVEDRTWANAWPNMAREPDGVLTQDYGAGGDETLSMWVEGIAFAPGHTILHVAVRNWGRDLTATLEPAAGAYIIDDEGTKYNFEAEGRHGQEPFVSTGEVQPGVIERFELSFPPTRYVGSVILKHPQFLPITIYQYKPGPALVSFCRPLQYNGWLYAMDISCDGHHVIDLSNGTAASVQLEPGRHTCRPKFGALALRSAGAPIEIDVLPRRDYYLRTDINFWGTPNLGFVSSKAECAGTP